MKYAFGVDLGGTTIKFGLFSSAGELIEKWEVPTRSEDKGKHLLADIAGSVLGKMEDHGLKVADVVGVGIGVPGAVRDEGFVAPCVNLDQWGNFDVADSLSRLLGGIPVKAVNDANAAALGEMAHGGGKGYGNVVFVTLGTGVGGGVIQDGRLLCGSHGAGGEIGHIKVADGCDVACGCGKRGCLEQFASATGLVRCAHAYLDASDEPSRLREIDGLTCKDVFDAAREGDAVAIRLVDDMCRMLGKALATISCVCDPEVFVIGGGVARAGDVLMDGVRRHFATFAFPAAEQTPIVLAELGNDAGIFGAAHLVTV